MGNNSSSSNSESSFDPNIPFKTWTVTSASDLEMLWIELATFTMDSPESEQGKQNDETQHQVTLTQGFHLGKYEITQAKYGTVMAGNIDGLSVSPSAFSRNLNRPVHFDMHENVWEWVADWYASYEINMVTDPTGLGDGSNRAMQGNS